MHITAGEALPRDVSQVGTLRSRVAEGLTQGHTANVGLCIKKASKSGSRAFFPVHFMSSIVRGTNASSTSTAVTSLPATGRWLASALGARVRSRLPLVRGTLLLIKNLSDT